MKSVFKWKKKRLKNKLCFNKLIFQPGNRASIIIDQLMLYSVFGFAADTFD